MFYNYLKTAVRSLVRHRFFSAINILGLAISMSMGMGLIMLVADQLSYDRFNTKNDRIYRVITTAVDKEGKPTDQWNSASCMTLREELLNNYTGIEQVVRLKRGFGNGWIEFENQDVNIPVAGYYADPEVFALFEYELQYGDPATALKEPYSVVLTRKAADKLFKEENPVGLTLKVGDAGTFTVTGVLSETNRKSHIVFEALASLSTVKSAGGEGAEVLDNWTNFWEGWTYILVEPGKTPTDVQAMLDKVYDTHIGSIKDPDTYKMTFLLQALSDITPSNLMNNPIGPVLPWFFVYFLGGLSAVILLTSCFNFTNLSIARSLTRAREIGVRKVTGAARWQIFIQFLSESIVVALLALGLALVFMIFLKPAILQLNFARIFRWDLEVNAGVYVAFVGFALLVGIIAGLFPALVLSGFQPVKVLKGSGNIKLMSRIGMRKVLLVLQFTLSLFFILTVLVVNRQFDLFMGQQHGFNMDSNIVVRLNRTEAGPLKNELLKYNNIEAVSLTSHVPAAGVSWGADYKRNADDPEWTQVEYFSVDEDYLENMELKLVSGRFFRADQQSTSKSYLVLNETAVRKLNFSSPEEAIGQELISHYDSTRVTIIGVVQDYNHRDLTRVISPMALVSNPERFGVMQVRYGGDYAAAAQVVEKAWATVNPGLKADYKEVSSEIHQFYEVVFGDLATVLSVIAFLAIFISCLGLLGMATYVTETRIREISIRKVLGSGSGELVVLLSRGFMGVLLIAVVLGVPAAYFANTFWLELIAYHTSFSFIMIVQGVLLLLLFGAITVGSQTIRATFVNPVENLKSE